MRNLYIFFKVTGAIYSTLLSKEKFIYCSRNEIKRNPPRSQRIMKIKITRTPKPLIKVAYGLWII